MPSREIFPGCCASTGRLRAKSKAQRVRTVIFFFMSFSLFLSTCHSTPETRPFSLDDCVSSHSHSRFLDWRGRIEPQSPASRLSRRSLRCFQCCRLSQERLNERASRFSTPLSWSDCQCDGSAVSTDEKSRR